METLLELTNRILLQFQSPTLAFLIGGIVIAALGTRLAISESIYKFIVFMLLLKVGLNGGMAIREANLAEMILPALFAILIGIGIVLLSRITLAMLPAVRTEDGIATGGLFGAVSGSTLAAAMVVLESDGLEY
ncbi:MAG: sodium-dependent bicarbonate transport family permease, partial [Thioalkalivibrio sp.]|nr:sodium-dependent bicarbonate transport family permease [Thioalkalivibrio sp.]